VRPFDDSIEVLKALRGAGVKTGLVTNAAMPMWMRDAELKETGLLEHLDVRLTAADVGKLKPHPEPFRVAMQRLNVAPARRSLSATGFRTTSRGRSWPDARGVGPARLGGFLCGTYKPNATIVQLKELLKVLDLWYPGWRKNHDKSS